MGKMTRANFMENNGSEAQLTGEVESKIGLTLWLTWAKMTALA
jgi:hypothetical protein